MSFEAFRKGGSKSCDRGNQGTGCRPDEGPLKSGREGNSEGDSRPQRAGGDPENMVSWKQGEGCRHQPCAMLLKGQATNQENPLCVRQGDEQLGPGRRAVSGVVETWWSREG